MREFAGFPIEDWLRQRSSELALAMALGLAFAWIGPFSTDKAEFLPSLGYWVGLLACWFILAALVERWLVRLRAFTTWKPWRRRALHACVTALPMLLVTAPATTALTGFEATVAEIAEMYFQVVVVGWGVLLLTDAILGSPEAVSSETARAELDPHGPAVEAPPIADASASADVTVRSEPRLSRLADRLPPKLRGPLVCLEMEDHYVRVHTAQGSALVLMRLGDAMTEAAPTRGAQAHRSWWVAADAIESFERTGRAAQLRLKNGLTAPVSQRYLRSIEKLARG